MKFLKFVFAFIKRYILYFSHQSNDSNQLLARFKVSYIIIKDHLMLVYLFLNVRCNLQLRVFISHFNSAMSRFGCFLLASLEYHVQCNKYRSYIHLEISHYNMFSKHPHFKFLLIRVLKATVYIIQTQHKFYINIYIL